MTTQDDVLSTVTARWPVATLGPIAAVRPIAMGLSGAGVYAVDSEGGAWLLRVGAAGDEAHWDERLALLRRVAAAGLAPAIVHVDDAVRATVQERIGGAPLPAALADPAQRPVAIASVVQQLRAVHALAADDVDERDPVAYARERFEAARGRDGFPAWAAAAGEVIDRAGARLASDPRRVLGHNDVNPGNVLWDGTRAWLVDWDIAGRAHPYYDLATLAMFLRLDDGAARGLLGMQEQRALDDDELATFEALRRLAAVLCGLTMLGMLPSLTALPSPPPDLGDVYGRMRSGALALQAPAGKAAFGLALLRAGVDEIPIAPAG